VKEIRASNTLIREGIGENVIHFSTLPWIPFTGISHPRKYSLRDSIPKITYGRCHHSGGRRVIPVSVHVHHSVADGLHVGHFYRKLQLYFNEALEEA
jgi:chloramphenicol O-acetyltransferase type A